MQQHTSREVAVSNMRKRPEVRDWTAKTIARDRDLDPVITDDLNYPIGKLLYHYGAQYRSECEPRGTRDSRLAVALSRLDEMRAILDGLASDAMWARNALAPFAHGRVVFNNAYVQRGIGRQYHVQNYKDLLESRGWSVLMPPWCGGSQPTIELARLAYAMQVFESTLHLSMELLLNRQYQDLARHLESFMQELYSQDCVVGCILPTAEPFFERATFRMMRELGKATLLSYHGFGGAPYPDLLGSAEYALLWGRRDAELLQGQGIEPYRTIVVGHPFLESLPGKLSPIGLGDVLVLSNSQAGAPVGNMPIRQNRGELVQYVDEIERVLKKLGVRSARLRPHPSETFDWYRENVDGSFYTIDEAPLDASLERSSCVVGGVSSVLLDAHVSGKPYVVYVPEHLLHVDDGGWPLMPPFDGSVPEIPFASTLDDLERVLSNPGAISSEFWRDYVAAPADARALVDVLDSRASKGRSLERKDADAVLCRIEQLVQSPPEAHDAAIIEAVRPFTMTPPARILALLRLVDHVCAQKTPGEFVECGVWKGGSSMAAALAFRRNGQTARDLYMYDTYEGMSAPTENDVSPDGNLAADLLRSNPKDKANHIWAYSPLEDVRKHMESTDYPMSRIRFIQGKVEETIPRVVPEKIALLRLDTDWYESTLHELEHLYPRLQSGGILLLDDYGFWQGARKAVDEFFSRMENPPQLHKIVDGVDDSAHWCVKP